MEVIVPAAGLSTRFPNMKPKYLLLDKNDRMMLAKSINPYLSEGHNVTVGILQAHIDKYDSYNLLKAQFGDKINIVVIPKVTSGPADTVYQIIKFESIKLYVDTYEKLNSNVHNEIFVSHIIQECLMNDCIFFEKDVQGYNDVGTIEDWRKYNESLT
jgi:hypothetical protein